MHILFSLALASLLSFAGERPVIMLTGFWPPTNEMVREFSRNKTQNPQWAGENWQGEGFDIVSYFHEFPDFAHDQKGEGDFEVDFADARADLERILPALRPVALLSFGLGHGPWEVEQNFTDYWNQGEGTLQSTLPVEEIAAAVNRRGALRAWVDHSGDPGSYLCGFLSYLGATFQKRGMLKAQGFIHVGNGYEMAAYKGALYETLHALIRHLRAQK